MAVSDSPALGASALRAHLQRLEERGLLHRVRAEVDPAWEIASVARQVFLGALAASREVYAVGLGVEPAEINERWAAALRAPLEPRLLEGGLPDETVLEGDAVDLTALPIPTWTPTRDAAPFVAGPYCITRHPDSGVVNVAMRRMMLKDRTHLAFN